MLGNDDRAQSLSGREDGIVDGLVLREMGPLEQVGLQPGEDGVEYPSEGA